MAHSKSNDFSPIIILCWLSGVSIDALYVANIRSCSGGDTIFILIKFVHGSVLFIINGNVRMDVAVSAQTPLNDFGSLFQSRDHN